MIVLGIETSCDETGVAIYDSERGLLADCLYSQAALHARHGGVVPELASRDHLRKIMPLVRQALAAAAVSPAAIGGVAYTAGPGLIGALLVGAAIGRSLALGWNVPAIGVHHMEGHLLAPMLEQAAAPQFPFIALLVSGGHTQLVQAHGIGRYQLLGESLDDAAGEAFDKVGKMLGLPYPAGPEVARLARGGAPGRFRFPRPMTNRPGLDFSFSGLKTFVRNTIAEHTGVGGLDARTRADIACGFETAMVSTLAIKCRRALAHSGLKSLLIAGGVSANQRLREVLASQLAEVGGRLFCARPELCTDNGAMIAYAGCQRLLAGEQEALMIRARPRWNLEELAAV